MIEPQKHAKLKNQMQKTMYVDTEIFWSWAIRLDISDNSKDCGKLLTFGQKKKVDVEPCLMTWKRLKGIGLEVYLGAVSLRP